MNAYQPVCTKKTEAVSRVIEKGWKGLRWILGDSIVNSQLDHCPKIDGYHKNLLLHVYTYYVRHAQKPGTGEFLVRGSKGKWLKHLRRTTSRAVFSGADQNPCAHQELSLRSKSREKPPAVIENPCAHWTFVMNPCANQTPVKSRALNFNLYGRSMEYHNVPLLLHQTHPPDLTTVD